MREVDIVRGKLQCLHCSLTTSRITIRNFHGENASFGGFETGRVSA
jgi:hypothetical protein